MLAIRMQRRGRKGHAQFRVVVQDSHFSPKSGRVVANLGSYDPHTKKANLNKELAEQYLGNGAQPSERVISVFKAEKVTLPAWVTTSTRPKRTTRNPEKLRKNQPEQPAEAEAPAEPVAEETAEEPAAKS